MTGGQAINGAGINSRSTNSGQERMKNLHTDLQELALIPTIKESTQFKVFLGINVRFPELCGDLPSLNFAKESPIK